MMRTTSRLASALPRYTSRGDRAFFVLQRPRESFLSLFANTAEGNTATGAAALMSLPKASNQFAVCAALPVSKSRNTVSFRPRAQRNASRRHDACELSKFLLLSSWSTGNGPFAQQLSVNDKACDEHDQGKHH
jgi:hypothetical protein